MTASILVTGGTGDIGGRTVAMLRRAGRDVRVLTRRGGPDSPGVRHMVGDTRKGEGLDAAFRGASTVLHLAGGAKGDDIAARHVVAAARTAGTHHLVLISVVGADKVPVGYLRAKASAERTIAASGIPFSTLRVAQLHSLLAPVLEKLSRMPVVPAPRDVRLEPVDGDVVAARLTELALGASSGRVADLVGPDVLGFDEIVGQFLAARHRRRPLWNVPLPGSVGRAYCAGANLATDRLERAGLSWEEYLRTQFVRAARGRRT